MTGRHRDSLRDALATRVRSTLGLSKLRQRDVAVGCGWSLGDLAYYVLVQHTQGNSQPNFVEAAEYGAQEAGTPSVDKETLIAVAVNMEEAYTTHHIASILQAFIPEQLVALSGPFALTEGAAMYDALLRAHDAIHRPSPSRRAHAVAPLPGVHSPQAHLQALLRPLPSAELAAAAASSAERAAPQPPPAKRARVELPAAVRAGAQAPPQHGPLQEASQPQRQQQLAIAATAPAGRPYPSLLSIAKEIGKLEQQKPIEDKLRAHLTKLGNSKLKRYCRGCSVPWSLLDLLHYCLAVRNLSAATADFHEAAAYMAVAHQDTQQQQESEEGAEDAGGGQLPSTEVLEKVAETMAAAYSKFHLGQVVASFPLPKGLRNLAPAVGVLPARRTAAHRSPAGSPASSPSSSPLMQAARQQHQQQRQARSRPYTAPAVPGAAATIHHVSSQQALAGYEDWQQGWHGMAPAAPRAQPAGTRMDMATQTAAFAPAPARQRPAAPHAALAACAAATARGNGAAASAAGPGPSAQHSPASPSATAPAGSRSPIAAARSPGSGSGGWRSVLLPVEVAAARPLSRQGSAAGAAAAAAAATAPRTYFGAAAAPASRTAHLHDGGAIGASPSSAVKLEVDYVDFEDFMETGGDGMIGGDGPQAMAGRTGGGRCPPQRPAAAGLAAPRRRQATGVSGGPSLDKLATRLRGRLMKHLKRQGVTRLCTHGKAGGVGWTLLDLACVAYKDRAEAPQSGGGGLDAARVVQLLLEWRHAGSEVPPEQISKVGSHLQVAYAKYAINTFVDKEIKALQKRQQQ